MLLTPTRKGVAWHRVPAVSSVGTRSLGESGFREGELLRGFTKMKRWESEWEVTEGGHKETVLSRCLTFKGNK